MIPVSVSVKWGGSPFELSLTLNAFHFLLLSLLARRLFTPLVLAILLAE
jgi:hypothetical protein